MTSTQPKRKRSAWYAFYPDDYSGGTRSMSLAGRGAFVELLNFQFANGSIPFDDRTICRIIGAFPDEWEPIKAEVLAKFENLEDGSLINRRMEKERLERDEIRAKRVEAINKRWNKTDTNELQVNEVCNDLVYTSTTTSSTTYSELPPTGANSSSASGAGEDVFPESESESLAKQGKSLESLASRLALPAESFIEHGASLGLSEAKVRQWADSRVANNWSTAKNKPLTPVTWPADMNGFAAASQEISSKSNHGKDNRPTSRNDNTANAGRAAAFAGIGRLRPGVSDKSPS